MATPAEKIAKAKNAKSKPPYGSRRLARRPRVFPKNILRQTREAHNLTQRDVSTGSGVNIATVADAEVGFQVNLTTALKLAAFYGKSIEELWQAE